MIVRQRRAAYAVSYAPLPAIGPDRRPGDRALAPPPPGSLPLPSCLAFALAWQVAGFAILLSQLVLLCTVGPASMLLGIGGVVALFAWRPLAGVTVYMQILLYQNLALSLFSTSGLDKSSFTVFQGFGFGALAGIAGVATWRLWHTYPKYRPTSMLVRWVIGAIAILAAYAVFGAIRSSPLSALIYFRNDSSMLLALLVGLYVGRTWNYRTIATIFLATVSTGLVLAVIEYVAPYAYYSFFAVRDYYHLKIPTDTPQISHSVDEVLASRVVTWFNVSGGAGGWLSVRVFGPNIEMISYAYVVAIFGIVGSSLGFLVPWCIAFCFLVLGGVKGPLIMFVMSSVLFLLWAMVRHRTPVLTLAAGLLLSYVAIGISNGLAHRDFHVIGFLGGVNGFLRTPWGHGIGVGGNLSETALSSSMDWQTWQKTGVDFALESAVGVLLYQLGIAAAAIYLPFVHLLRRSFARVVRRLPRGRGSALFSPLPIAVLFLALTCTLVNGIFQEEAYSPYALGLLALLSGCGSSSLEAQRIMGVPA